MTPAPKPLATRRWLWPRFTLRVLLVFVTFVGVGLGYWTHRAREQARIVKVIEESGGMVCYEREGPAAPEPRNFVVEWLAGTLGRDYFEGIVAASIQERELVRAVAKFRRLERLQIFCDELDDRDVAQLARCRAIEVLNLGVDREYGLNRVTDQSLLVLSKLPRLRALHVRGVGISEAGIKDLGRSPRLEVLDVGSCAASVDASDFDTIKQQGRVQSFLAWRRARSGPDEIIARW